MRGEIAAALAKEGMVNVVVRVALPLSLSREQLDNGLSQQQTRAATKARIRAIVDPVIRSTLGEGAKATPFLTSPSFSARVTLGQLEALAAHQAVESIQWDLPVQRRLGVTIPTIQAGPAATAGATGNGRTVVVMDQGVQRNHPFIGVSRIVREACFLSYTTECPNGTAEQIGPGAADWQGRSGNYHGTHVAGIALGRNPVIGAPRRGVALRARLMHVTVLGQYATATFRMFSAASSTSRMWFWQIRRSGLTPSI